MALVRPHSSQPVVWYPERMQKASEMDKWIWKSMIAEVNVLTQQTSVLLNTPELPVLISFVNEEDEVGAAIEMVRGTGLENKGKLVVAVAQAREFEQEINKAFSYEIQPGSLIVWHSKALWIHQEEAPLTAEVVADFAKKYLAGEAFQQIKSLPEPEQPYEEGHTELVGATFGKALTSGKHLLVFLYAPWCGHCKHAKPWWRHIAKTLEPVEEVMVASVDASSNSLPKGWTTKGYPTIRVLQAGQTENVFYNGDRTAEALQSFLEEKLPGVSLPALTEDTVSTDKEEL